MRPLPQVNILMKLSIMRLRMLKTSKVWVSFTRRSIITYFSKTEPSLIEIVLKRTVPKLKSKWQQLWKVLSQGLLWLPLWHFHLPRSWFSSSNCQIWSSASVSSIRRLAKEVQDCSKLANFSTIKLQQCVRRYFMRSKTWLSFAKNMGKSCVCSRRASFSFKTVNLSVYAMSLPLLGSINLSLWASQKKYSLPKVPLTRTPLNMERKLMTSSNCLDRNQAHPKNRYTLSLPFLLNHMYPFLRNENTSKTKSSSMHYWSNSASLFL